MPQRRSNSPQRTSARSRRDAAAERWLLLLGTVTALVIVVGSIGPWSPVGPESEVGRPLTMAEARASNAAVPIFWKRRSRPVPFRFQGGPAGRDQAAECLATAALYEVGTDGDGQKAVIQVILNRVQAPGFPKTVCGVVYQGYARSTGCQFSFTCDGSVERRTVHLGWSRARRAARRALSGHVFAKVGRATHYHADWVVPYWRGSLTKVSRVGTHLFYERSRT